MLKLVRLASLCTAPQYVAEDLLQAEGFTEVRYVKIDTVRDLEMALASGEVHLSNHFAAPLIVRLDQTAPIVILAGVHVGCYELFGTERVRTIRDLKGKTVSVPDLQTGPITFLASMAAYVGLNPQKDITWVTHPRAEAKQLLAEGKIDAFLGFPPDPQELRAKQIGHVVVNSAMDRPWSQYFCCMVTGNQEFVHKHVGSSSFLVRWSGPGVEPPSVRAQRITSSAWKRSVGGMVRPRVWAVLRLMTSSNFIGCSTGRSAGLAPFKILST
jgi:NitT/TauT family transport system substrate-binding protein